MPLTEALEGLRNDVHRLLAQKQGLEQQMRAILAVATERDNGAEAFGVVDSLKGRLSQVARLAAGQLSICPRCQSPLPTGQLSGLPH